MWHGWILSCVPNDVHPGMVYHRKLVDRSNCRSSNAWVPDTVYTWLSSVSAFHPCTYPTSNFPSAYLSREVLPTAKVVKQATFSSLTMATIHLNSRSTSLIATWSMFSAQFAALPGNFFHKFIVDIHEISKQTTTWKNTGYSQRPSQLGAFPSSTPSLQK